MVQQRAGVRWLGTTARGSGTLRAASGALDGLAVDLPNRRGESHGRTSPEELLAAAHATCFTMALGAILAADRTPPEVLDVEAVTTMESVGDERRITRIELVAHGHVPDADPEAFARAVKRAERECLISRTLVGNVEISATAVPEPRIAAAHVVDSAAPTAHSVDEKGGNRRGA
jgi:osmotically inducible protein OsmC